MPSSFDYIPSILFMIIQVLCMLTSSLRSLTEMDTKPDSGTGKKKKSEAEAKRSTNSVIITVLLIGRISVYQFLQYKLILESRGVC